MDDVEVLVLDEADRLLEMGFKDELKSILDLCRNKTRQSIMVSATLNQDLKELSALALKEPLTLTVQQQQRKADKHRGIQLRQYVVRLKFDELKNNTKK